MRIYLTIIWAFSLTSVFGQKKLIDSSIYSIWPSLGPPTLSDNGQYIMYSIQNVPTGSATLILQKTDAKWKKEFILDFTYPRFTADSKYLLFNKGNDSLGTITLGSGKLNYTANPISIQLSENSEPKWSVDFSEQEKGKLVVKNLKTRRLTSYLNIIKWEYIAKEQKLLLCSASQNSVKDFLNILDLPSGRMSRIWEGDPIDNIVIDTGHRQLAFKSAGSIFHYKFGRSSAVCILNKNSIEIEKGSLIGNLDRFSKNGERLFFQIKQDQTINSASEIAEIWRYNDIKLHSELGRETKQNEVLAVIDISHKEMRLLQRKNDYLYFPRRAGDNIALVKNSINSKEFWNVEAKVSWHLISTITGKILRLGFLDNNNSVTLSPSGKYLIYSGLANEGYFSYEIATNVIENLTKGIQAVWKDNYRDDLSSTQHYARGFDKLVWLKNDAGFLAFDSTDIWKLDPKNEQKPVNLTNGYGERNNIVFNFALYDYLENEIESTKNLYLSAFNKESKENGFYSIRIDHREDPKKLIMGPYIFDSNAGQYVPYGSDFVPIKARNANRFIVRRMSSSEAPNYFFTSDFKHYTRLSNLQPNKNLNWYTTELHAWKSFDGRTLKGVLYKPENFDPTKQYPVIFYYYERKSDALNAFLKPEKLCGGCSIDIPTYVSNGYLVFSPDIYYKPADPMQGTYDAVVSAAKYLASLSFIDPSRIGIQGCSFGGLQTNYIVTHTNLFKAAVSASSLSDMISHYGSIEGGDSSSLQSYYENGQARMGASLWEIPELYIKNSPIFNVNKVTTPILLMHTKQDDIYPYSNVLEFFTGLRRLGKKVWMLVYPQGNHGLSGREAEDFSIKMKEFFDHYLKDNVKPQWMIGDRLSETDGKVNENLLTDKQRAQIDSLINKKPINTLFKLKK